MNIFEMHKKIQDKRKELEGIEQEMDATIKAHIGEEVHYDEEKDCMVVVHFHYRSNVRVSMYPVHECNEAEEYEVIMDAVTYVVSSKNVTLYDVKEVHEKLMELE